jgi:hypothetical protein
LLVAVAVVATGAVALVLVDTDLLSQEKTLVVALLLKVLCF